VSFLRSQCIAFISSFKWYLISLVPSLPATSSSTSYAPRFLFWIFACKESVLVPKEHSHHASCFGDTPVSRVSDPRRFPVYSIHINNHLLHPITVTRLQYHPSTMDLVDRSYLDCDPFGVIPINDTTPLSICALFGNNA
jgi:hypothetical protein